MRTCRGVGASKAGKMESVWRKAGHLGDPFAAELEDDERPRSVAARRAGGRVAQAVLRGHRLAHELVVSRRGVVYQTEPYVRVRQPQDVIATASRPVRAARPRWGQIPLRSAQW